MKTKTLLAAGLLMAASAVSSLGDPPPLASDALHALRIAAAKLHAVAERSARLHANAGAQSADRIGRAQLWR